MWVASVDFWAGTAGWHHRTGLGSKTGGEELWRAFSESTAPEFLRAVGRIQPTQEQLEAMTDELERRHAEEGQESVEEYLSETRGRRRRTREERSATSLLGFIASTAPYSTLRVNAWSESYAEPTRSAAHARSRARWLRRTSSSLSRTCCASSSASRSRSSRANRARAYSGAATKLSASSNATDANGLCAPSRRIPPRNPATSPTTSLSASSLLREGSPTGRRSRPAAFLRGRPVPPRVRRQAGGWAGTGTRARGLPRRGASGMRSAVSTNGSER